MTDSTTLPTRDDVIEALEAVHDPHVPVSLRRMGMLRDITVGSDGVVTVQICIPCMACPGAGMLRETIREAVSALPGVQEVVIEEGWHLPWSRDMIEPEVQDMMRANGIQV
jgi:ATP-binding protein involved in chromosome partitioning